MDIAPLRDQGSSDYIVCKVDPAAVTEENMSSMEADDPRVNSHKDDWKACTASSPKQNTFGAINSISSIGKGPNISIVPQQDVDSLGKITDLSMVMPFPKGTAAKSSGTVEERTGNPKGLVGSAGELGYIHTGLESSTGGGKPWRTLRFQPNNSATTVVPDWAFMDLFTVPVESGAKGTTVFSPHQTATGGRLNMNAKAEPFGMERIYPLAAVVKGARKDALDPTKIVSDAEAQQIAKDIYNRALSLASTSHPAGKPYGYANGYDSPGEVVEIKGVADGGEASEELVREIANVITARGSVFGVYSVGQAVKQIPSGQLVVTGEQRLHTMIERYTVRTMDDKGTPLDLSDDTLKSEEVRFAPVYTRQLSP